MEFLRNNTEVTIPMIYIRIKKSKLGKFWKGSHGLLLLCKFIRVLRDSRHVNGYSLCFVFDLHFAKIKWVPLMSFWIQFAVSFARISAFFAHESMLKNAVFSMDFGVLHLLTIHTQWPKNRLI